MKNSSHVVSELQNRLVHWISQSLSGLSASCTSALKETSSCNIWVQSHNKMKNKPCSDCQASLSVFVISSGLQHRFMLVQQVRAVFHQTVKGHFKSLWQFISHMWRRCFRNIPAVTPLHKYAVRWDRGQIWWYFNILAHSDAKLCCPRLPLLTCPSLCSKRPSSYGGRLVLRPGCDYLMLLLFMNLCFLINTAKKTEWRSGGTSKNPRCFLMFWCFRDDLL